MGRDVPFAEVGRDVPFAEVGRDVPFPEVGRDVPFPEVGRDVPFAEVGRDVFMLILLLFSCYIAVIHFRKLQKGVLACKVDTP